MTTSEQKLAERVEKLEAAVLRIAALLDELSPGSLPRDRVAEGFLAFQNNARTKELTNKAGKPGGKS